MRNGWDEEGGNVAEADEDDDEDDDDDECRIVSASYCVLVVFESRTITTTRTSVKLLPTAPRR
jgi:hypothetical protein